MAFFLFSKNNELFLGLIAGERFGAFVAFVVFDSS
jgi:hypothetical protein